MPDGAGWFAAEAIETVRLTLEPLRVAHAAEMAPVLNDAALHRYIGGAPATLEELRGRYGRLVSGRSPSGDQGWLNWIVRVRASGATVGTVQATLTRERLGLSAELAWVIGTAFQGRGYAGEAAAGMAAWLRRRGVRTLTASIHPEHEASARVAERLGLVPTDAVVDGEVRWTSGR